MTVVVDRNLMNGEKSVPPLSTAPPGSSTTDTFIPNGTAGETTLNGVIGQATAQATEVFC